MLTVSEEGYIVDRRIASTGWFTSRIEDTWYKVDVETGRLVKLTYEELNPRDDGYRGV